MASISSSSTDPVIRIRNSKVEKIFKMFDENEDGRLNRQEMASLVIAVNPRVKFSEDQIDAILNEVFRTYGSYIDGDKGLSYEGLLRTYDDGAGDVDRDFVALGLKLDSTEALQSSQAAAKFSIMDERPEVASSMRKRPEVGAWASSPNNGITFDETWNLIGDLEILLKRLEAAGGRRDEKKVGGPDETEAAGSEDSKPRGLEQNPGFATFKSSLGDLRRRAEASRGPDEAFDAHMAVGRVLFDHKVFGEALISFQKAIDLKPTDLRPHFRAGNALYSLGRYPEARVEYQKALDAGQATASALLLPQVRVNLGIALEAEGMLLSACEQYREAAILNSNHFRALKHLGSALLGVGEYKAAQKPLENAVYLKPDYADAHCDLGSVLHALKDDRAFEEFRSAIDLQPNHIEALYNLGGLLRDDGKYASAADIYAKVLNINPRHWQAQLNRAVALLGDGKVQESRAALKEAFRMTNRVEVFDELERQKHVQKKGSKSANIVASVQASNGSSGRDADFVVVEPSKFGRADESTTERVWLGAALEIRLMQKQTRVYLVDVSVITNIIVDGNLPLAPATSYEDKVIRKPDLERVLREDILHSLNASTFQGAVKVINERILGVLDRSGTGRVDLGYFFAILAPICAGPGDIRKQTVFDCLLWRTPKTSPGQIPKKDMKQYLDHLQAVFLPAQAASHEDEYRPEDENESVSYPEFLAMFEDPDLGFGILNTLLRLEARDRDRHRSLSLGWITCAVCSYTITGLRFKEVKSHFNLCSQCYSEGKVPATATQDEFCFKEFRSSSGLLG